MTKSVTGNRRYIQFSPNLDMNVILKRPVFVGSFCLIPRQESFAFFCSKLGPNLSDMKVRTFVKKHCILESNLGPFAGF